MFKSPKEIDWIAEERWFSHPKHETRRENLKQYYQSLNPNERLIYGEWLEGQIKGKTKELAAMKARNTILKEVNDNVR